MASWRLSYLLVVEEGPFSIFAKLRYLVGLHPFVYKTGDSEQLHKGTAVKNGFSMLFTCVWCMSIWTSLFIVGVQLVAPSSLLVRGLVLVLAVSAGQIVLQELLQCLLKRK
jgi:hypothetical protein